LALALIVLVAGTSTVLTFSLYARTLDDSIGTAMQQAVSEASYYREQHLSLKEAAKKTVTDIGHSGLLISISDASPRSINDTSVHQSLADNWGHRQIHRETFAAHFFEISALLFGLHPGFAHASNMDIEIYPDFERLVGLFALYWAIVLPVCALALLTAWLIARRITHRAIDPLVEVTHSLHRIAAGDFQPEPLLRNSGELGALIGAYNDVAYRLTTASNEREQNALQMRQFIADAGHELRTPLTIVMGYLDVLRGGVVRDPNGVAHIHETMLDESRRMKTLVDKLIFLARLERPEAAGTTQIDIDATVHRIVRSLEPIAGNRIHITSLPAKPQNRNSQPPYVIGDESEISQAIENTIQNALKYAPESAVRVALATLPEENIVRIEVSDRGPGMSEQDVVHAFDRFYRGDMRGSADGSGLGLAIAKRAVERAGGSIGIRSTLGEGTAVTLEMPLGALPAKSEKLPPAVKAQ
jgi:signal transduction histidine kinase